MESPVTGVGSANIGRATAYGRVRWTRDNENLPSNFGDPDPSALRPPGSEPFHCSGGKVFV